MLWIFMAGLGVVVTGLGEAAGKMASSRPALRLWHNTQDCVPEVSVAWGGERTPTRDPTASHTHTAHSCELGQEEISSKEPGAQHGGVAAKKMALLQQK